MGNPVGIGHSQPDEGKDAEFGVQYLAWFGLNFAFIGEQIVEVADEVGKQFQKRFIKFVVEIFAFFA